MVQEGACRLPRFRGLSPEACEWLAWRCPVISGTCGFHHTRLKVSRTNGRDIPGRIASQNGALPWPARYPSNEADMAATAPTPSDIRQARIDNPKLRERDLADQLGISEAALVAAHAGSGATRIAAHPDRL